MIIQLLRSQLSLSLSLSAYSKMLTIQAADRWVILAVAKVEIIRFSRENEKENERE